MHRKLFALIISAVLALPVFAACSDNISSDTSGSADTAFSAESTQQSDSTKSGSAGITMTVKGDEGKLSITRAERKNTPMGEKKNGQYSFISAARILKAEWARAHLI